MISTGDLINGKKLFKVNRILWALSTYGHITSRYFISLVKLNLYLSYTNLAKQFLKISAHVNKFFVVRFKVDQVVNDQLHDQTTLSGECARFSRPR